MNRPRLIRRMLLTPLVYLAALILLFEEWCWDLGVRLVRWLATVLPLQALDRRISALPPYWALALFVLPAILLFPVKVLALMAIAAGHVFSGVTVLIVAKIGGAAAVARLYLLTRPSLLSLAWFARWHDGFMALKERWVGRLKATRAWCRVRSMMDRLREAGRMTVQRIKARPGGRHSVRPARLIRRILSMWRARRRGGSEQ